jgi:hypothetical protein
MDPIFHLSSQIIGRNDNRSSVACAAYRSGETLHDEKIGVSFKFQREDRVAHKEIIAPEYAQDWARDRSKLWNSLEAVERRKDAQLATEINGALPNNVPKRLQREMLLGWVDENFTSKGFVVDFVIHHAPIGKPDNDHFHAMIPIRKFDPETGQWRKTKDRPDSKTSFQQLQSDETKKLRESWAKHVNAIMEREGIEGRIDHRSHKDRELETLPTIHEGRASREMEARGEYSDRVAHNLEVRRRNRILEEIKARVIQAHNAAKRAAAAVGRGFTPAKQAPAPKKEEPAPAPIAAKPEPIKPPVRPPPTIPDVEVEKRKKAAREAAWRDHQGGGGIGG